MRNTFVPAALAASLAVCGCDIFMDVGGEHAPCFDNDDCRGGLTCLEYTCVSLMEQHQLTMSILDATSGNEFTDVDLSPVSPSFPTLLAAGVTGTSNCGDTKLVPVISAVTIEGDTVKLAAPEGLKDALCMNTLAAAASIKSVAFMNADADGDLVMSYADGHLVRVDPEEKSLNELAADKDLIIASATRDFFAVATTSSGNFELLDKNCDPFCGSHIREGLTGLAVREIEGTPHVFSVFRDGSFSSISDQSCTRSNPFTPESSVHHADGHIDSLAVTADGKLMAMVLKQTESNPTLLRFIRQDSGSWMETLTLNGGNDSYRVAAFPRRADLEWLLAVGTEKGLVLFFNVDNLERTYLDFAFDPFTGEPPVIDLEFSPDGNFLAVATATEIALISLEPMGLTK